MYPACSSHACGLYVASRGFLHSPFFLLPSLRSGFEVALPRSIEAEKTPSRHQRVPGSPLPHGCTVSGRVPRPGSPAGL